VPEWAVTGRHDNAHVDAGAPAYPVAAGTGGCTFERLGRDIGAEKGRVTSSAASASTQDYNDLAAISSLEAAIAGGSYCRGESRGASRDGIVGATHSICPTGVVSGDGGVSTTHDAKGTDPQNVVREVRMSTSGSHIMGHIAILKSPAKALWRPGSSKEA